MISFQRILNRVQAAGLTLVFRDDDLCIAAIDPVYVTRLRAAFADQPQYLRWLDRDYRMSQTSCSGVQRGWMLHKGTVPNVSVRLDPSVDAEASTNVLVQLNRKQDGTSSWPTETQSVWDSMSQVYTECTVGVVYNAAGDRVMGPGPTGTNPKVMGLQRQFAGYPNYVRNLWDGGGNASPSNANWSSTYSDRLYAAVVVGGETGYITVQTGKSNLLLISGPTALTVGHVHPSGFAWVWAHNSEVAGIMEADTTVQGADLVSLKKQVQTMRATDGGIGTVRGTSALNPFSICAITRESAQVLVKMTGVKDGVDFDLARARWSSGQWLPFGGRSEPTESLLATLYGECPWVVSFVETKLPSVSTTTGVVVNQVSALQTRFLFTPADLETNSPLECDAREAVSFAKTLGRAKAALSFPDPVEGEESIRTAVRTAYANPGDSVPRTEPYPTVVSPFVSTIGSMVVAMLFSGKGTESKHPANALCNPNFTASI